MKRFERDMPHVARWCNTSTLVDVGYMSCAVALIHEQRGLHPSFRRLRFRAGMWKSCSCVCKIFMIFPFISSCSEHMLCRFFFSLLVRSFV